MNLNEALAAFPPGSSYADVLPGLLDPRDKVRQDAYNRLRDLDRVADGQDPMATTWKLSEAEASAQLAAAVGLPFPPPRSRWQDVVHDLVFPLIRSPHPTLVAPARDAYPRLTDRAKCAVLGLLGACGTRDAAEAFMSCIREQGWPASVYSRVFSELPKLLDHPNALLPDLIRLAGPNIGGVTDALTAAIAQGRLDPADGKCDLESVAPFAVERLGLALEAAGPHQRGEGVAWRFGEEYGEARQQAGCWLDIAGHVKSAALDPLLDEALGFSDPRLLAFAAVSRLRRGGEVDDAVLHRVAGCHETCELFFEQLRGLKKLAQFPRAFRTWDAFAAAGMVSWLSYPTELGRPPDELEKMAVFTSTDPEGERALYVWRFRTDDGPWHAGTSGPYLREGEPHPQHGHLTFSRFDEWDQATAEEHAAAVLETLEEWRREPG